MNTAAKIGAIATLGAIAGVFLWKTHRVWGFILGGMAAGAAAQLVLPDEPPALPQ